MRSASRSLGALNHPDEVPRGMDHGNDLTQATRRLPPAYGAPLVLAGDWR
jgi:hypothetical protein